MAPKELNERVSPLNAFDLAAVGTHAQPREEVRALPRAQESSAQVTHTPQLTSGPLSAREWSVGSAGGSPRMRPSFSESDDDDGALHEASDARQAHLRGYVLLRFLVGPCGTSGGYPTCPLTPLLLPSL